MKLLTSALRMTLSLLTASAGLAHAEDLSIAALKKMSLDEILQVEIVSKQKENKNAAPGIVSVVTHDDIKRFGANSLFDVLNRVTSMYMLSSYIWSNGMASMRGDLQTHVNNHTLVLINGRPFRDSAYGGLNETVFRDFPIHHIEQIEVIRGAGSVLYGTNAFSGVINIVTQKNKENSATLRGRYGSYNTGQAEGEFAWKNSEASITGAFRHRASDGWLTSANDERKNPVSFRNNDGEISASLSAEWKDFTFNGFIANNDHNHWGSVPIGSGQPIENKRLFLDLGYKNQLNEHWTTQWNLTYNKFDQNYDLPVNWVPILTKLSEDNLLLEQASFFNFFEKKLNFVTGGLIEWQHGRVTQRPSSNTLAPYEFLKTSLYAEINYAILDNLKFNMGGQWNLFTHLENAPLNSVTEDKLITGEVGRLGLIYDISSKVGVKLLYSQAYRSPGAGEYGANSSLVLGNRNLVPERIETADAQIFYQESNYQVSLTAFRSRQSNLIVRTPIPYSDPIRLQYNNGGSATFEGFEFESDAKLFEHLHWKGSYTFQTNRNDKGNNNKSLVPNHMAKIGLSYDINEDLQISAFDTFFSKAKVASSMIELNPEAASFHNVSVNTNYSLDKLLGFGPTKHVTFTFYLDNLFNEQYYYPEFNRKIINTIPASPGRMLFGELAIQF